MTLALEGVQTRTVSVTADREVQWPMYEARSYNGMLLTAPDCPSEVIDAVLGLNTTSPVSDGEFRYIGEGGYGDVYTRDQVAYKVHKPDKLKDLSPASELLANIALSEGLKRIDSLQGVQGVPFLSHNQRLIRVTGPEYYAALIPRRPFQRSDIPSGFIVAMSLEEGFLPFANEVPRSSERQAYYRAAVGSTGLDPSLVGYDDADQAGYPRNILIRQNHDDAGITMTKLDVMAAADFAAVDFGIV